MEFDKDTGEIRQPFLRTAYNYDVDLASEQSGLACPEDTLAQQHFAEECDINTIVRRFGITGQMPDNLRMPQSGDFVDAVNDFHTAMNMIKAAEEEFMRVPGELRARFDHDAGKLMAFLEDPANDEEAIKLGFKVKPVEPEPVPPVPVIIAHGDVPVAT